MYCNVLIQKAVNIRDDAIGHSGPRVIAITGVEKEINVWVHMCCHSTRLYVHPSGVYLYWPAFVMPNYNMV